MRLLITLSTLLLVALTIIGCDECSKIDDPPPSYMNHPVNFLLIRENPGAYLIKLSHNDDKGLYHPEDIDFLNDQGISVKDSLFFIQERDIVFQSNGDVVREDLIQNYQIVFSPDYTLNLTMEHLEFTEECSSDDIAGINLIVQDNSYALGSDLTIYVDI